MGHPVYALKVMKILYAFILHDIQLKTAVICLLFFILRLTLYLIFSVWRYQKVICGNFINNNLRSFIEVVSYDYKQQ